MWKKEEVVEEGFAMIMLGTTDPESGTLLGGKYKTVKKKNKTEKLIDSFRGGSLLYSSTREAGAGLSV